MTLNLSPAIILLRTVADVYIAVADYLSHAHHLEFVDTFHLYSTPYSVGFDNLMDLSDVGVRHAVAFTTLNIKHSIEIPPSAVSIARELRYCVIAVVVGVVVSSITKIVLSSRNPSK